jgi:hypothetical protein
MPRTIDFKRVSTLLGHLYCGPDKNSNTISLWVKFFKGVLNSQEVKRLFEAFAGNAGYLHARSPRMMVWSNSANPDNWTPTWCQNFFNKYNIQSVFGATLGPDGKVLHSRQRKSTMNELVYNDTTGDFEEKKPSLPSRKKVNTAKSLSSFSDEDLYAELQRRDEERKAAAEFARKKSLVEEFLNAYELTMDDLMQIAEVI